MYCTVLYCTVQELDELDVGGLVLHTTRDKDYTLAIFYVRYASLLREAAKKAVSLTLKRLGILPNERGWGGWVGPFRPPPLICF